MLPLATSLILAVWFLETHLIRSAAGPQGDTIYNSEGALICPPEHLRLFDPAGGMLGFDFAPLLGSTWLVSVFYYCLSSLYILNSSPLLDAVCRHWFIPPFYCFDGVLWSVENSSFDKIQHGDCPCAVSALGVKSKRLCWAQLGRFASRYMLYIFCSYIEVYPTFSIN